MVVVVGVLVDHPPAGKPFACAGQLSSSRLIQPHLYKRHYDMPPVNSVHARSHSLLLLQKLLNVRDAASPLTLVLDSLEQPAQPLIAEIITRAKVSMICIPNPAGTNWRSFQKLE